METQNPISPEKLAISEYETGEQLLSLLSGSDAQNMYLLPGHKRQLPQASKVSGRHIGFVSLSRQKEVIEYSAMDQVISLSLGLTLSEVAEIIAPNNQFLPLDADPDSTLFELINNGEGGSWEHSFGGTRDLVLGTSIILSSGETVRTGGKVVKNVTGYDTTKLIVGGRMYFGIPIAAHLRLFAKPEWLYIFTYECDSLLTLLDQAAVLMQSEIPLTSLDIKSDDQENCMMVVELAGHKSVVNELSKALAKLTNPNLILASENYAFSDRAHGRASRGKHHQDSNIPPPLAVELSTSLSEMRLVLTLLTDTFNKKFVVEIRPAAGRFSISFESESEQKLFLSSLETLCNEGHLDCVVARSDAHFERIIEHFSANKGSSPRPIIEALKNKFDSRAILNPLVSWA
ncbi:MAG: FAD-binding oxidoreductase [Leptolyngbya sp.]|nr:FAD-binding oxidoreductase [Candidatus Melainabacteria bacterium]